MWKDGNKKVSFFLLVPFIVKVKVWRQSSCRFFKLRSLRIWMCKGSIPLPKRMNFRKSSKRPLTPPHWLLTIVKKPQCTKSLGPNQPQNLKLRLCIWQQGSLFLILSYPGLFKNIPHIWFLRLYSFLKNLQYDFPKMRRGGGQRPFGTFPKIHPFWKGEASLIAPQYATGGPSF